MQVKPSQATAIITALIKAKLVPMLAGSPGLGKSSICHQIAEHYGLKVIDLRLAQCDPCDLLGFPTVMGTKSGYIPMETFPIEGDPIPEGYNGWLLFMDEFTSASMAVQAAAYKIVLDRMIGIRKLHSKCAIVCAGNKETDNAIVQPMSTALQSRLAHLELVLDVEEWIVWAQTNGIDPRITGYIQWFKPGNLYTFKPDHTDHTYACPRTWEFLNRVVSHMGTPEFLPMSSGIVGEGVAREFITYSKIHEQLPKPKVIEQAPETTPVPDEPDILYAITGSIAHNAKPETFEQVMKYVTRLPKEFQVVTLRETVRRNKGMQAHPAVRKWIATSAVELF